MLMIFPDISLAHLYASLWKRGEERRREHVLEIKSGFPSSSFYSRVELWYAYNSLWWNDVSDPAAERGCK
jgi:hypothetical protein